MEIYFIRHGQTTSNAEVSHAGWAPVELTELGRTQAETTGRLLEEISFDRLYVSDLVRTQQTADIIFPDMERVLDRRIREHDVGILEYQKVSDCIEKYGQSYLEARARDDFTEYQGESADEFADRVADFMSSLEQTAGEENPPSKVAVVCHEGSVFYAFCYILGMRLPKKKLPLANCSVSKAIFKDGQWKIGFWNVTGRME